MKMIGMMTPDFKENSSDSKDCFKTTPDYFCNDVEVSEFVAREAAAKRMERIKNSSIPAAFLSAQIECCVPDIQKYAEGFSDQTSRGLVIRGDVGRGKTYSGCAVLLHAARDYPVRFATMGDVLAEIRASYNNQDDEAAIIGKYRNVRLLMLDDLGKEKPTAFALEKTFAIIDGRYRAGKPTIVTTQYPAQQLAERLASNGEVETAEAIISRLQECLAVLLRGPDKRS